jgi:hypothetical protein
MSAPENTPLKVAVIEGFHPFEVPAFRDLFRAIDGIDPYHQTMENWAIDCAGMRKKYDVLVFYNMNQKMQPECDFCRPSVVKAVEELGDAPGQGIVVLHHAILAYPESAEWTEMVGIPNRNFGFHMEQTYNVEIAKPSHPIVKGMSGWEMFDETYTMDSAGDGSETLLTTSHEKSMTSIAWTRQHRNARVFCFQMGHDGRSWIYPQFRDVLSRGIQWAAGRL